MIPNQTIHLETRPMNKCYKEYYFNLGYDVYNNNFIDVNICHLTENSHKRIKVICDYCKEEYNPVYKSYMYNKTKSHTTKDCCAKCVQQKIEETMVEKYGVEYALQRQESLDKQQETCLKRYGEIHYSKTEDYKNRIRQTNLERRGVEYPMQSEDVRVKRNETFVKNGTIKVSKPQLEIYNMLYTNGYKPILNYSTHDFFLDIAIFVFNKKIDIEYDGWYWHQDKRRDAIRNNILIQDGWNVLRVKSANLIPTIKELENAINTIIKEDIKVFALKLSDWKDTA